MADDESVRMAMDQAWRDHHHARDQTWRALQIVAVLAAGLVGVNFSFDGLLPTLAAGLLTVIASLFGMAITLRHRNDTEKRKFTHIVNCERHLGLDRTELIGKMQVPNPITVLDLLLPWKNNTSLFILRMHAALLLFATLFILARVRGW